MREDPPNVDSVIAWANDWLQQRRSEPRNGGAIELRRFFGGSAYTDALEHLRIAHVTDIHVGRVTPEAVQHAAVDLVNREEPDLVVVTGDFVAHSQLYLDQLEEVMSRYNAPTMAVLGNHDHWSGADAVRRTLRRAGIEILDNVNTVITLRHQRLQVVGLDDAYTGHADHHKALRGVRNDLPTLGLSHIAEEADFLWAKNIPLVLAGHTHGGQITLARLHELMIGRLAGHRYVHGLYGARAGPEGTGAVYVGAGIGSAVVPVRVGERGRREVTMFELGHAASVDDEHHEEQPPKPGRKPSAWTKERRSRAVIRKRRRRERRKARQARSSRDE